MDPLEYLDGMGLYQYVSGNPITYLDAMGTLQHTQCGGRGCYVVDTGTGATVAPPVYSPDLQPSRSTQSKPGIPNQTSSVSRASTDIVDDIISGRWNSPVAGSLALGSARDFLNDLISQFGNELRAIKCKGTVEILVETTLGPVKITGSVDVRTGKLDLKVGGKQTFTADISLRTGKVSGKVNAGPVSTSSNKGGTSVRLTFRLYGPIKVRLKS